MLGAVLQDEAHYKLCKVKRQQFGKGGVPYIVTHDGRTIRYPDPDIKASDLLADCSTGLTAAGQLCAVRFAELMGRQGSFSSWCMQVNDTIVYDLVSGKVTEHIKFDLGQVCMVVGGKNRGRVGTVISREKHKGSFDIGIVRDAAGNEFATRCGLLSSAWWLCKRSAAELLAAVCRLQNVFVIGKESNPLISLPKGKGVRLTIIQEQEKLYSKA